jgi:hypothetical protein
VSFEECHETNVKLAEKLDSDNTAGKSGMYRIAPARIARLGKAAFFINFI